MRPLVERVRVCAPATTANLGPGFDALGLALEWLDEVDLEFTSGGLAVAVVAPKAGDGPVVPLDARNLVVRGARAVLRVLDQGGRGLRVGLRLSLPVGRGLGSSAAAVAAGLVGTNRAFGDPLPPEQLIELGADIEGHPDNVAAAILGGMCVTCRAEGGLHVVRLDAPRGVRAVVAVPDCPLDTVVARRALPTQVSFTDAVANIQRACLLVAAVARGRVDLLGEATRDLLHQPYRAALVPGLQPCLEAARVAGALGAFLSGAGPSVLALVPDEGTVASAVGEAMRRALEQAGGGQVHCLDLRARGAEAQTG